MRIETLHNNISVLCDLFIYIKFSRFPRRNRFGVEIFCSVMKVFTKIYIEKSIFNQCLVFRHFSIEVPLVLRVRDILVISWFVILVGL